MRTVFTLEVDTSKFADEEIGGEFILRMIERHNRLWLQVRDTEWTNENKEEMREMIRNFTNCKNAAVAIAKVFDSTMGSDYESAIQEKISEVTGGHFAVPNTNISND